jgi:TolB-like protein/Flp pilus assembly protein TadD
MSTGENCILEIRTLGHLMVALDGVPIPETRWPRQKTKDLLKLLLTDPGHPFTFDQLADALLPDADAETAVHNIQARTSELRRVLEPELVKGRDSKFIVNVGEGYAFAPKCGYRLDTEEFGSGLDAAHKLAAAGQWAEAIERFEDALTVYRDDFLPEDRYADWAEHTRSLLRNAYLEALSSLASCYAELGRLRQAIAACERLLRLEPYRETAIRQLMTYQRDAGYWAQALDTFHEGERVMREYLDVEPSAETLCLRDEISQRRLEEPRLDRRRIAVLPLQNYSPNAEDDYIADGMTEELIATIAKAGDLRVVARTSVMRFKNTKRPVAQIARDLSVGTILEGSVRKIGSQIRISAQLIDATTEDHLWAEHYDLDLAEVLEMQAEIARRASRALKLRLLPREDQALREAEEGHSEAHIAYLKGRHFLRRSTRESLDRAIRYFEEALRLDSDHARALTGLAEVWCAMVSYTSAEEGYTKARRYAERALALDDTLAEAYCSLASVTWGWERDFDEAERILRHAIALDPSCALGHARLALLLAVTDRIEDAIVASKQALSFDPLAASLVHLYAACLYRAARFHEAIEQAKKAIELDPELDDAWWELWYSLASTWDWDEAERVLREIVARFPRNPKSYVYLAMCVQCRGRLQEGVTLMEKARALPGATDELAVLFYCGNGYYFARQYAKAEQQYLKVLERIPAHEGARVLLAKCHVQRERFDEALQELNLAEHTYGISGEYWLSHIRMERGGIYALRGESEKAEEQLALLMDGATRQNRRLCVAILLHALGRVDEALDWAEASVEAREPHVNAIRKMPSIPRTMREHPRFQALLERVGLAD